MTSKLPGVGIFGTEGPTYKLVPILKQEGFHVEAVWGRLLEDAEVTAQDLGIPNATNKVDEVLLSKGVDLIVILCPPAFHAQIAVKALGIGKHVTVQTPGGLNQEECLRMVQAAQYYPRLLSTLNNGLRFVPAFTKMKSAIRSEMIGPQISLCDVRVNMSSLVGETYSWMCDSAMGGGLLNNIGSQLVDLLHYLIGQKAVRVLGNLRTLTKTTEAIRGIRHITSDDFIVFQMELEGGTLASVTLNSQVCGFEHEICLCGSEGHIVARNGDLYGWTKGAIKEEKLFADDKRINDLHNLESPLLSGIYIQGLENMFKQLASRWHVDQEHSFVKDDDHFANFENARYVHAVIEAIRRSSRDRAWTKVTYDEW